MIDEAIQRRIVEQGAVKVSKSLRPIFDQIERDNDRLIGEMRRIKRAYQRRAAEVVTAARARDAAQSEVESLKTLMGQEASKVATLEATVALNLKRMEEMRAEQPYTFGSLPGYVDLHDDAGSPPIGVFDLHGSLTPSRGFPIEQPPWPSVKECMDEWVAGGIVIVVATAALSPDHAPQVLDARLRLAWEFVNRYSLPVRFIAGKVGAHMFLDDRMVRVPTNVDDPWRDVVYPGVMKKLALRADKGKDGVWRLKDLPDVGKPITSWPDDDQIIDLRDTPRGYSTRVFDVDIHRCLLESNTSARDSATRPGAREVVNRLFDMGFTIHPSCAGWDPASKEWQESRERLAGLQRTLKREQVKYDEIVAKLHGTFFVDDKGMEFGGVWDEATEAEVMRRMSIPEPEDEITGA